MLDFPPSKHKAHRAHILGVQMAAQSTMTKKDGFMPCRRINPINTISFGKIYTILSLDSTFNPVLCVSVFHPQVHDTLISELVAKGVHVVVYSGEKEDMAR